MLGNSQLRRSFSGSHTQMFKYEIGSLGLGTCLSHVTASYWLHGWLIPNQQWCWDPKSPLQRCITHGCVSLVRVHNVCHLPSALSLGLSFGFHLKMNIPFPFLQWCHCLGSGLRGPCRPRSLPPAPWAPGQSASPIPFIDWCLWASLWDAPTAPAAKLKILPCPSLFTPAGQGRTLIWKAFPGIWLHETHSIKAPHHQTLSLLSKF